MTELPPADAPLAINERWASYADKWQDTTFVVEPDLYTIVEDWLGERLTKGSAIGVMKRSRRRWQDLSDNYIEARGIDPQFKCLVGLPEAAPQHETFVAVRGQSLADLRRDAGRALACAHGVSIESSLMASVFGGGEGDAVQLGEDLAVLAELRDLRDVGAVRIYEPPFSAEPITLENMYWIERATVFNRDGFNMVGDTIRTWTGKEVPNPVSLIEGSRGHGDLLSLLGTAAMTRAVLTTNSAHLASSLDAWMRFAAVELESVERSSPLLHIDVAAFMRVVRYSPFLTGQAPGMRSVLDLPVLAGGNLRIDHCVELRKDSGLYHEYLNALKDVVRSVDSGIALSEEDWTSSAGHELAERLTPLAARLTRELAPGRVAARGAAAGVAFSVLGSAATIPLAGDLLRDATAATVAGAVGALWEFGRGRGSRRRAEAGLEHIRMYVHFPTADNSPVNASQVPRAIQLRAGGATAILPTSQ